MEILKRRSLTFATVSGPRRASRIGDESPGKNAAGPPGGTGGVSRRRDRLRMRRTRIRRSGRRVCHCSGGGADVGRPASGR
ncbi:Hypothetical protein NTJ_00125 [Nesidiocoris tenuis]|uniref:Uncharacterized protein n=1 Tax=Nesidiocoris tenuis TaxID=355587 RepID=A0ABN7A5J9_9HEMI|nr:Hypothetical protein NTJ_00125 [Nesidiocoris tenuis]